jgi:glyoxylase-like metal-dependent hydrolase (beta-lactamase superfamily II)
MPASYGSRVREIDVLHLGTPRVICCYEVDGVIIDPGPESSHRALLEALDEPPRAILLTHIHLDHAGATGRLAELWPEAEVWVHERGAPHLVDPSKLIASATRLYGDDMDRLWGEWLPVPEERLRILRGGETVGGFDVVYTPGHASHHVAYLHRESRTAFTGDVAGVRVGAKPVLVPTPPPDIDLEAWRASVDAIEAWGPERLAPTHFGFHDDVGHHLAALREGLDRWGERARVLDEPAFVAEVHAWIEAEAEDPGALRQAMPPETLWKGLHRYWTKRADAT